jgi:hypothetical protein
MIISSRQNHNFLCLPGARRISQSFVPPPSNPFQPLDSQSQHGESNDGHDLSNFNFKDTDETCDIEGINQIKEMNVHENDLKKVMR